jgi:hypothetical protein
MSTTVSKMCNLGKVPFLMCTYERYNIHHVSLMYYQTGTFIHVVIKGLLFSWLAHMGWSVPCLFAYKAVARGHITRDILSPHWGISTHYNAQHIAIKCDLPYISCRTGVYSFVIIVMTLFVGRSHTWGNHFPKRIIMGCHLLYTAEWLGCSHMAVRLCFLCTWLTFALVFLLLKSSVFLPVDFSHCSFRCTCNKAHWVW